MTLFQRSTLGGNFFSHIGCLYRDFTLEVERWNKIYVPYILGGYEGMKMKVQGDELDKDP
jgi:hypothetical protein